MKIYKNITGILMLVLYLSGCNQWLDIRPVSEVSEDKMFSTEQGYQDALYGIYVNLGKKELYGGNLTTALDVVAQYYMEIESANAFAKFRNFDYKDPKCTQVMDVVWKRLYYCIALANNILLHLENENPKSLQYYNYYKGESLALRAYLHYELLRIFAPNIKKMPDYVAIPYKRLFSNDIEPQLKVKEIVELVIADLEDAKECLKEDVIRSNKPDFLTKDKEKDENNLVIYNQSDFLKKRKYQMNYYAVLATLARVHIDLGTPADKEKAYQYAMEVINSGKFRPVQEEHLLVTNEKERDIIFTDEFIFGLYSRQVDAFHNKWLSSSGGMSNQLMMVQQFLSTIFESINTDYRYRFCFDQRSTRFYVNKHVQGYTYSSDKIRMLTLPEMYYIASEAKPEAGHSLMPDIMSSRHIDCTLTPASNTDDVMMVVLREYRKEFVGDGQFFYTYKRLADEPVMQALNVGISNQDKYLVFPLPDEEIKYGDRKSEIWSK